MIVYNKIIINTRELDNPGRLFHEVLLYEPSDWAELKIVVLCNGQAAVGENKLNLIRFRFSSGDGEVLNNRDFWYGRRFYNNFNASIPLPLFTALTRPGISSA